MLVNLQQEAFARRNTHHSNDKEEADKKNNTNSNNKVNRPFVIIPSTRGRSADSIREFWGVTSQKLFKGLRDFPGDTFTEAV